MNVSMMSLCMLVLAAVPAQAETCASQQDLSSLGIVVTQQGGVVYDVDLALLDGSLEVATAVAGAVGDVWRQNVDYQHRFHVPRAGEAVARILAPEATAGLAKGSRMSVLFNAPQGVTPVAGQVWTGKLVAVLQAHDAATNKAVTAPGVEIDALYSFLAETDAKIGGCHYRAIPVEFAASHAGTALLLRRSLFFPDLGISVMTIWGPDAEGARRRLGILAMSPAG